MLLRLGSSRVGVMIGIGLLVCLFVISRTTLAPEYLYYFDSVNFALALDEFNPVLHQPQPPGYPLFVAVTRVVYGMIGSAQHTFVLTGLIASAIAVFLVWRLGRDMFGNRAGMCAACLLLFNPPFWFGGLTNQVRLFLVLGGAGLMLACWRSLRETRPHWFYGAAAFLGAASGFRPELLIFGGPLLIYTGWRARRPVREWAVAAGLTSITAGAWVAVVLATVGGLHAYIRLIADYSSAQFGATALPFGAELQPAYRMMKMAIIWYGVPVLTWLWLLPFAKGVLQELKDAAVFLGIALMPAFLFHTFIHVGDPDHTLIGAPVICVIGGLVVARAKRAGFAVAAVALNIFLFFLPQKGIGRACSYYAVRDVDRLTQDTFAAVRDLKKGGPVVLVAYDHQVTWRHLSYYFPECPLIVLRDDPRLTTGSASAWRLHPQVSKHPKILDTEVKLRPGVRVIWLLSRGRGMHNLLRDHIELKTRMPIAYSDTEPGQRFQFGRYHFISGGFVEPAAGE